MVEKDLKRLIDALEARVKSLEEQLAFQMQENDSLRNEIVNLRSRSMPVNYPVIGCYARD
jgi:regulator of replication initiation timing